MHVGPGSFKTVYLFQQMSRKSAKIQKAFAVITGEMYPVGLCLHILPDVLRHDYCGFLAEPSRLCLETFGSFFVCIQARRIPPRRTRNGLLGEIAFDREHSLSVSRVKFSGSRPHVRKFFVFPLRQSGMIACRYVPRRVIRTWMTRFFLASKSRKSAVVCHICAFPTDYRA